MPPMLYDYTTVPVESVAAETDDALATADALVERAIASADSPGFEATLQPLELAGAALVRGVRPGGFMGQVHTDPAVRDAGNEAEERINKWRVALIFRDDLYGAVRAFADTDEATALTGERARLLEHWLRDLRRAGHELSPEDRAELERLRTRLVEVEVAFQRNINEFRDGIEVTREQLAGLPDDFIERLSPGDREGTYRVTLDYPEVNPFLEQAHDRELRRALFAKNWNKAVAANRPLLEEALELRRSVAALLGEPTWAHHAMELKMARNPERVGPSTTSCSPPLRRPGPGASSTLSLSACTPTATTARSPPGTGATTTRRCGATEYGVDQNLISEYFPLDPVMDGMFAITGEVLGLDYRVVENARAWHESVRLYEIRDRSSGAPIAHFYADLFPREGKFGHAAAFPMVVGHRAADGDVGHSR